VFALRVVNSGKKQVEPGAHTETGILVNFHAVAQLICFSGFKGSFFVDKEDIFDSEAGIKNNPDLCDPLYAEFVVPLVKAIQEQQQIIEKLKKRIEKLEEK